MKHAVKAITLTVLMVIVALMSLNITTYAAYTPDQSEESSIVEGATMSDRALAAQKKSENRAAKAKQDSQKMTNTANVIKTSANVAGLALPLVFLVIMGAFFSILKKILKALFTDRNNQKVEELKKVKSSNKQLPEPKKANA